MLKKGRGSFLLTAWIGGVALCFTFMLAETVEAQKELRLGMLFPLTGPSAQLGKDSYNGFKMYFDEVGYDMAGVKVKVLLEDTEAKPAAAVTKGEKLIRHDKVHMLAGVVMGNVGYAVGDLADRSRVPFICSIAASDDLTQRKLSKWVLRTSWSSSQPSHPFGKWAYDQGYRRISLLGADFAFAQENIGGFHKAFEDAGGKIVQRIWVPLGTTDFAPYLPLIKKDVDAVHATVVANMPVPFLKQYKDAGLKMPLIGGGTITDETVLPFMGDEAIGVVTPLQYSAALDTPKNKAFVKKFRDLYGKVPSYFSESCYTTGQWIHETIKRLNGDISNIDRFLEEFKKVEINAIRGPVRMDKYNNPVHNIYVRKVEKIKEELWNTVIATYPGVSQFGTYNPEEFLKQPVYSRSFPDCKYCE